MANRNEPSLHDGAASLVRAEDREIHGASSDRERARSPNARVLVVNAHRLIRAGVTGLLRSAGLDVVGEAPAPQAAATAARELTPDVVLMDVQGTGVVAAEAVRLVAGAAPHAHVVVLVASAEDSEVLGALAAGACGAVLQDAPTHEIVTAIRSAAEGDALFSPAIARHLMRRLRLRRDQPHRRQLSARELEVLELLVRGWDNARIAATLYMSRATVKHHISSILVKLDVDNRVQAAVRAVQQGLVEG